MAATRGEEHAAAVGAPVERLFEQPQRQREEAVAEDHAGVLQPRRRRAAEHEDHRRDDGAGRVPAAAAEQRQDGERAGQEMGEDDERRTAASTATGTSQPNSSMVGVNSSDCGSATEGWPLKW